MASCVKVENGSVTILTVIYMNKNVIHFPITFHYYKLCFIIFISNTTL